MDIGVNMIVNSNSKVKITYVRDNVTQVVQMISKADADVVRYNLKEWRLLTNKQQKEFEKTHKVKFDFNEVTEDSPLAMLFWEKKKMELE
jgi:hypothetical protein